MLVHLLEQQFAVAVETGDEVLGEVEEAGEHLESEMFPTGALQHEADNEEPAVLNHVLLHRGRTLHQLTDEPEQL